MVAMNFGAPIPSNQMENEMGERAAFAVVTDLVRDGAALVTAEINYHSRLRARI